MTRNKSKIHNCVPTIQSSPLLMSLGGVGYVFQSNHIYD